MRRFILGCAILGLATSCNNNVKSASETANDSGNVKKGDVLVLNMDSNVSPTQDFFLFTNGRWIKENPIPGDQGSWGIGQLAIEENLKRLREISEKAAAGKASAGSTEQKIGDFWATAMDSNKIEQSGLQPLQPYLDKINTITDVKSLVATSAEIKRIGSNTLFANFVTQDDKNSNVMSYKLWQGGMYLPEREYYLKTDSATVNIRNAYQQYIIKVLSM